MLSLNDLSVRARNGNILVHPCSLRVRAGECVGLIGPNGAGKSTLLKATLGLIQAQGHSSLTTLSVRERALHATWLPQERQIAWNLTAREIVRLGRLPHESQGYELAELAMQRLGLLHLSNRPVQQLSGGEQARVLLARAICQNTPLLLADEPIANLDPAAQILALEVLREKALQGGGVLVAIHDLGLAARLCTRLVLMDGGRLVAGGPPEQILTPAILAEHFGIRAHIDFGSNGPIIQPLGRI